MATGHLTVTPDNTYDIGAVGANRPRDLFLGRNLRLGTSPVADPADSTIVVHNPKYVQSPTDWSRVALTWPTNGAAMLLAQSNSSTYGPLGLTIGTDGSAGLSFRTSGSARWEIHSGGDIRPLTHNWYDIGTVSMRPRALYIAAGGITTNGNLTLEGTGRRITGDMSNATIANRLMIQTSAANGDTNLGLLPNGTSQITSLDVYNAADPTNASFGQLYAFSGGIGLAAGRKGAGAYQPLLFSAGGAERMRIGVDGVTDIVAPRATGNLTPSSGAGVEFVYIEPTGYVQSLARNPVVWKDLNISGKNITFYANGGAVNLPVNTIKTADIQANAVQQLHGSYRSAASWAIPSISAWYESPVQVTATVGGGVVRVEATGAFQGNTAGQVILLGLMVDGVMWIDSLLTVGTATANQVLGYSFACYVTPTAGSHRFALAVYLTAGTAQFWTSCYQHLWVTEQKR